MKPNKLSLLTILFILVIVISLIVDSAGLKNKKKNKSESRRILDNEEIEGRGYSDTSMFSNSGSSLMERNRDEKKEERRKLSLDKDDSNESDEKDDEEKEKKNEEVTTTISSITEVQNKFNKKSNRPEQIDKLYREKELEETNKEFARKVHLNSGGRSKRSDEIHSLGRAKELDEDNEIVNAKPKTEKKEKRSIKEDHPRRIKKFDENSPATSHKDIPVKKMKTNSSSSSEESQSK
uniref:Uncharacterized protein n=1 Tax=Parastrongyloides trichosuri TaxID=131310 RepID=A0A0N4ZCQ2_PARTI